VLADVEGCVPVVEVAALLVSPVAALVLGVAALEVELGQLSDSIFTLETLILPFASVDPVIST